MDLLKLIRELREERDRLDEAIAALEILAARGGESEAGGATRHKRGRKSMSEEERALVSERMKQYWKKQRGSQN
jgi:hypothetical protein